MPIRVFQFPLPTDPELVELNQFLAAHRIVAVHRETVSTANGPLLLFVVQYLAGQEPTPRPGTVGESIDYREVLTAEDYNVFCLLRNRRKELADGEGTAVFRVFSNAHLAAMVQNRCLDLAACRRIPGISETKLRKYGEPMIQILREQFGNLGSGQAAAAPADDAS